MKEAQTNMMLELHKMVEARQRFNGGNINLYEVITEAKFTLAINDLIVRKNTFNDTGQIVSEIPLDFIKPWLDGVKMVLQGLTRGNAGDEELNMVIKGYKDIVQDPNAKDLINSHYNRLFSSASKEYI